MSECGRGSDEPRKRCSRKATEERRECVETRDEGYNECSQTREDRQKNCCTWWPCSWGCKAFHWLVSVVCIAWRWVENIVCVAWHTVVEVVCVAWIVIPVLLCHLVDAIVSAIGAFAGLVEAALNWAWSLVGYLLDVFLSIPILGRILNWAFELAKTIVNFVISIPDIGLTLLGVMPEKKLRLGVIVLKGGRGPVVTNQDILLRAIQCAINIYREECNIRVVPIRYAQYQMSFDEPEQADAGYIFHDTLTSDDKLLDACCEACALGADLVQVGKEYQLIMSRVTFWGNGRRLLGYGSPIVAFTVRSYKDTAVGCSIGPLGNYVTVQFQDSNPTTPMSALTSAARLGRVSTLAHEIAHACNVLPHEDGSDNLMSKLVNGDRFCRLNRLQKALIRGSRHVTYF